MRQNLSILLLLVICLLTPTLSIPYIDQICLTNSLIVGRSDQVDLVRWQCKTCTPDNRPLRAFFIEEKSKDIKCVLSVYEDFVVLGFRYTNTAQNVWQDILYPYQVEDNHMCLGCKVQKAYDSMWDIVKKAVKDDLWEIRKQTKLEKLYITGISMGGGLSVISAVDLIYDKIFPSVEIITFGAPRVGNNKWAQHFDTKVTNGYTKRYILKGDPIVVMPICITPLCTYQHVGIQIVCYQDLDLCVQNNDIPGQYGWKKLARKFEIDSDIKKVYLGGGIDSHINSYPKLYDYTLRIDGKVQEGRHQADGVVTQQ